MQLRFPSKYGPTGPQGDTGPRGPTGPINQAFANGDANVQTISGNTASSFGTVAFIQSRVTTSGISFNGTDSFTVINPGVYVVHCLLHLSTGNTQPSLFAVRINDSGVVNQGGESGQVAIQYVGSLDANSTIKITNASANPTTISLVYGTLGSAGSITIYRIADNGLV